MLAFRQQKIQITAHFVTELFCHDLWVVAFLGLLLFASASCLAPILTNTVVLVKFNSQSACHPESFACSVCGLTWTGLK